MKKLGFGTMRLPLLSEDSKNIDLEQTKKMFDIFLSKGFTYFDTAYMYHGGMSEVAVKECLVDRYPRDKYTVTTKLPPFDLKSFEDRDKIFNDQLQKTGLEYFDYYWLHCIMESNYDSVFQKFDCFNWLYQKKEAGLVKHVGFSFHGKADLLERILNEHPEVEIVQLQINYLDWDTYDIQSEKCYDLCVKYGKKVVVMEPVKGGVLANLSPAAAKVFTDYDPNPSIASWAVRFAASKENVMMVLSGMSNIQQTEDNCNTMESFKPLTAEEDALCLKVAEVINSEKAIKCTACSYCTKGCPQEIDIPRFFKDYNRYKQTTHGGTLARIRASYAEYTKTHASAGSCIECGQCENACPQHLPIREYLKEVHQEFVIIKTL